MLWYQQETSMPRNTKTIELSEALGLTRRDTIGLLSMFWCHVGEQFEDGNLTRMSNSNLEEAVGFKLRKRKLTVAEPLVTLPVPYPDGKRPQPGTLLRLFITIGFIDEYVENGVLVLEGHEWYSRNGYILRARERKRLDREKKDIELGMSPDVAGTGRGQSSLPTGSTNRQTTPPTPPRGGSGVGGGKKAGTNGNDENVKV